VNFAKPGAPTERPCSCDEALALRAQVREIEAALARLATP
jgi:hypothetical protein